MRPLTPPRLLERSLTILLSPFLLSSVAAQPDATPTSTPDVRETPKPIAIDATCEARTANYITHTLPQQCLTSSPLPRVNQTSTTTVSIVSTSQEATEAAAKPREDRKEPTKDELDDDHGSDGDLGTAAAFMSFEEWKEMMLKKSGQDPLEPRTKRHQEGPYPGESLDSLGDEGEIDLNFDAYSDKISEIASSAKGQPTPGYNPNQQGQAEAKEAAIEESRAQYTRSKDAGKTCKERFSYSSFDAGATVLKTSNGAQNPKAILVENKDTYMLLECGQKNKFVIVELSDDILVDTVVIANFEFFSSMVREFRVSVSDRWPVKMEKWKDLGTFQARNARDIQPFLIENPQIWARYLRLEFLSHYGKEFYCPISLLRVHGTRMLDSWKEADPSHDDVEIEEEARKGLPEPPEEAVEQVILTEEVEEPEIVVMEVDNRTVFFKPANELMSYWNDTIISDYDPAMETCAPSESPYAVAQQNATKKNQDDGPADPQPGGQAQRSAPSAADETGSPYGSKETSRSSQSSSVSTEPGERSAVGEKGSMPVAYGPDTSPQDTKATTFTSVKPSSSVTASTKISQVKSTIVSTKSSANNNSSKGKPSTSITPPSNSKLPHGNQSPTKTKTTTSTKQKGSGSSPAAAASPTVQESFFKSISKRLNTLESNTTLSLKYIEEQSRSLREALFKLEKRQLSKVDTFLSSLNSTVLHELREVRIQYDQIWQSTVIALESEKERSEREIVALSARLSVLGDEIVFQKRMAIVQSVLLLCCLLLVIFSRGGLAGSAAELYASQFLASRSGAVSPPFVPSSPDAKLRRQSIVAASSARTLAEEGHTPTRPQASRASSKINGSRTEVRSDALDGVPESTAEEAESPEASLQRSRSTHSTHSLRNQLRPHFAAYRAVSEAAGMDYFRPPTPSSLTDIGYDSEPALTPNRDIWPHATAKQGINGEGQGRSLMNPENDDHRLNDVDGLDDGANGEYPDTESPFRGQDRRPSDRQLTPASELDEFNDLEYTSRQPLSRQSSTRSTASHVGGSGIKPLPALPEDSD